MKQIRKSVALFLAALMLLSVFAVLPVSAAESAAVSLGGNIITEDRFVYSISEGEATVAEFRKPSSFYNSAEIPESVQGYPVTALGQGLFKNNTDLNYVTIPAGVKKIGSSAFEGMTSLSRLFFSDKRSVWRKIQIDSGNDLITTNTDNLIVYTFGDILYRYYSSPAQLSVYAVKEGAYDLVIPESIESVDVTTISSDVFTDKTFDSVTIPDSVRYIHWGAFRNANVKSVVLGSGVTKLSGNAFSGNIENIYYNGLSEDWEKVTKEAPNDWLSKVSVHMLPVPGTRDVNNNFTSKNVKYNWTPDGTLKIVDYTGNGDDYDRIFYVAAGYTLSEIGEYAFMNSNLTRITIPKGIIVANSAFYHSYSLESVTVKSAEIGNSAFAGCTSLKRISLENTVSIGSYAFSQNKAESVKLPETVSYVGECAFKDSSELLEVVIQGGEIAQKAFYNCHNLNTLKLGDRVSSIGAEAFLNTDLSEIELSRHVETIGDHALGYTYEGGSYVKRPYFTISGWNPSAAKAYADANGFSFNELGTVITSVSIVDFIEPDAGEAQNTKGYSEGNTYTVMSRDWYNDTEKHWMTDGEKFVGGNYYKVYFHLEPLYFSYFSDPMQSATINGKPAKISYTPELDREENVNVSKTFYCKPEEVISDISISVDTPKMDMKKSEAVPAIVDTEGVEIADYKWEKKSGTETYDSLFNYNCKYLLTVCFHAKDGWRFSYIKDSNNLNIIGTYQVMVHLNDKSNKGYKWDDREKSYYMCAEFEFPVRWTPDDPSKYIEEVRIDNAKEPIVGEAFENYKFSTDKYDVDVVWRHFDSGNFSLMEEGERFIKGNKYICYFNLYTKNGYVFRIDENGYQDFKGYVNGREAKTNGTWGEYDKAYVYDVYGPLTGDETQPPTVATTAPVTDKPTETVKPTEMITKATDPTESETAAPVTTESAKPTTAQNTTAAQPIESTDPTESSTAAQIEKPTTAQPTESTDPTETSTAAQTEKPTAAQPTTVEPAVEPTTAQPATTVPATETQPSTQAPTQSPTAPAISSLSGDADKTQVDTFVKSLKTDSDPKGSVFFLLAAKAKKVSKSSVTLSWNKVKGAKSYVIYGNKCGVKNRYNYIATVSKTSFAQKKLSKGTYYKYLIMAFDGSDKLITASKTLHISTKGGKTGNYKKLTTAAKGDKVILAKKGKSFKLKAKAVPENKKLKVKQHRKISYESSDTKIAKVSKSGKITAKKKGVCYVYAYAQSGAFKKIKVKVKK